MTPAPTPSLTNQQGGATDDASTPTSFMTDRDPLDGLEREPQYVQTAVLANEVRNQANRLSAVERKITSLQVGVWGLVISLFTIAATLIAPHLHGG